MQNLKGGFMNMIYIWTHSLDSWAPNKRRSSVGRPEDDLGLLAISNMCGRTTHVEETSKKRARARGNPKEALHSGLLSKIQTSTSYYFLSKVCCNHLANVINPSSNTNNCAWYVRSGRLRKPSWIRWTEEISHITTLHWAWIVGWGVVQHQVPCPSFDPQDSR